MGQFYRCARGRPTRITGTGIWPVGRAATPPWTGWVLQGVHDPDGHEVKFYANSPDAPDLSSGLHVRES